MSFPAGRAAVKTFDADVKLKKELGVDGITFDVPKVLMTKCGWEGGPWPRMVYVGIDSVDVDGRLKGSLMVLFHVDCQKQPPPY